MHGDCECAECVARLMEAAQIGRDYGLYIAQCRLEGNTEPVVLTWEIVRRKLRDERD